MSFSVDATGPQPQFRIMPWTPVLIPLHLEWRFFSPSSGPSRSQSIPAQTTFSGPGSRYWSSSRVALSFNDQRRAFECWCSARLQGPEGFFFASSIDTDQRASSSRSALTRRKASASLLWPAGFCFASSLDTTQVHGKPSRTSGLLFHEQPHRRSDTLTDWSKDRCVFLGLCARRMWLIFFALQVCDICKSDRGFVLRVTCVQSRLHILYYRCGGEHLSLYVRTCDCLSYIYLHSASIHTMVSAHVWYIYSLSAFNLWIGLCRRLRACMRSGLLQVWCW